MHKIDWCKGGVQLADVATKKVGKHDLSPIMIYIMVRLDNQGRKIYNRGDIIHDSLWNSSSV